TAAAPGHRFPRRIPRHHHGSPPARFIALPLRLTLPLLSRLSLPLFFKFTPAFDSLPIQAVLFACPVEYFVRTTYVIDPRTTTAFIRKTPQPTVRGIERFRLFSISDVFRAGMPRQT